MSSPWTDSDALPNIAQEAVGGVCLKGTLPLMLSLVSPMTSSVFYTKLLSSQSVLVHTAIPNQWQDSTFPFAELHRIPVSHLLWPLKVLLNGSAIMWCYQPLLSVCTVCKLAEGALSSIVQTINKDVKQYWPYYQSLGYIIRDQFPTGLCAADHNHICPAAQPVFQLITLFICLMHTPSVCQWGCYGRRCQKPC